MPATTTKTARVLGAAEQFDRSLHVVADDNLDQTQLLEALHTDAAAAGYTVATIDGDTPADQLLQQLTSLNPGQPAVMLIRDLPDQLPTNHWLIELATLHTLNSHPLNVAAVIWLDNHPHPLSRDRALRDRFRTIHI